MVEMIKLQNAQNKLLKEVHRDEIIRLSRPPALEQRIQWIDKERKFRRLYVMGCGRSGTSLLTAAMGTFDSLEVVATEMTFLYFGLLVTNQSMLVLKRDDIACRRIEIIPASVEMVYIVRHPFDVLTSRHPAQRSYKITRERWPGEMLYHITPERWLAEMLSLQYLVDTRRPNTKIIRYEDLVTKSNLVQSDLSMFFRLTISRSIQETGTDSSWWEPTDFTTIRDFRKIDAKSINKYRTDPAKVDYLKRIIPRLGRLLHWVAEAYQYDVTL